MSVSVARGESVCQVICGWTPPFSACKTPLEAASPCVSHRWPLREEVCPARGPCCANEPGLPDWSKDAGSLFLFVLNRRRDGQLVCVGVGVSACACARARITGP